MLSRGYSIIIDITDRQTGSKIVRISQILGHGFISLLDFFLSFCLKISFDIFPVASQKEKDLSGREKSKSNIYFLHMSGVKWAETEFVHTNSVTPNYSQQQNASAKLMSVVTSRCQYIPVRCRLYVNIKERRTRGSRLDIIS